MATRVRRAAPTAVYLETGKQRVFACALDWPGWCRSGREQAGALEALAAYSPRYAAVAKEARMPFPSQSAEDFEIVERVPGSATTDFGAPGEAVARDRQPITGKDAARLAALVRASWTVFDRVVAKAPASLRKGPRGGGRDRDVMVDHVLGAEVAYARKVGLRLAQPARGDTAAISAERSALAEALQTAAGKKAPTEKGWPAPYAARRIAWHVLDHAWEMEDRSTPAPQPDAASGLP